MLQFYTMCLCLEIDKKNSNWYLWWLVFDLIDSMHLHSRTVQGIFNALHTGKTLQPT